MKDFLLCLGMLLASSSVAYASEKFEPNGSLGFTQTFYGNSGSYKTATSHPTLWLSYQFAPKWNLDLEWDRTWNMYSYNGGAKQQNNDYSEPSATLNYAYGYLGASKVDWSSSLQMQTQSNLDNNSQAYVKVQSNFDFAKYLPTSEYIQPTQFALTLLYAHGKNISGPSGTLHSTGLGLLTNWELPANFSLTMNAYAFKDWYKGTFIIDSQSRSYSNATYLMLSAWLEYSKELHQFDNNKASLSFNFAGGFDPYISSNRRAAWDPFLAGNEMYQWLGPTVMEGNYKSTYTIFALPQLTLSYHLDKNLAATAFVQAKYSNQVWGSTEKSWRWQPQAGIGLTYLF